MNVLMLYSYAVEQKDRLRGLLDADFEIQCHLETDPAPALVEKLGRAEVVISPRFALGLPPAPRLGLIQSPVAGYDKIDPRAVPENCAVCNVFEHEIGVAEYALLAMLEWTIRLSQIDQRFRAGSWQDGVAALGPRHGELYGKTLGIIGVGHIASAIAQRAAGFGVTTIGVTRNPKPSDGFDQVSTMAELDDLLPRCDFVILACPLTPDTTGLLDARRLELCKNNAVIINLARGPVIDEQALFQALKNRRIGGAVLDVWYQYPSPEDSSPRPSKYPFHELDNVVMTPHCSSWSEGLLERRWEIIARNMRSHALGQPLRNIVTL